MNTFLCQICQKLHRTISLIEFPQPTIISEITSGHRQESLHVLGKHFFAVNKKKIL